MTVRHDARSRGLEGAVRDIIHSYGAPLSMALFFLLASMLGMFRYLKFGISVILVFVGFKMMAGPFYHVPTSASLCVIAGILAASIAASLLHKEKKS